MPRFKVRPYQKPRLAVNVTIGVSGTLAVQQQQAPIPVWYGAPTFTVVAGQTSDWLDVPVYAAGNSITLGWHSSNNPSLKPAWVEFQNGANPRVRFLSSIQDTNDVSPLVLMATANSQTILSSTYAGTGALTVLATADWTVSSITFTEGVASSVQLAPPLNATPGGRFFINSGGLAGVSVSEAGLVSYDGTSAAGSTSIVFTYFEPGALPELTLHGTGTNVPYMATVFPLEGVVPSGYTLGSDADSTLTGAVLSTWGDGSAKVMALAGHTSVNVTKTVPLKVRSPSGVTLTTAAIASAVVSIAVDFGGGVQTLSNFTTAYDGTKGYDFTWWASDQVICARYRLSCGLGSLEAVIDIHGFAGGRAFVEVVVENGKLTATAPVKPALQTYTNATVAVNGTTIATVSPPTSGTPITNSTGQVVNWSATGHEAFRAWYASTWIGGDPNIAVTHDTASLQAHPMLFRPDKATTVNLDTTYASDTYARWDTGRYQPSMGGGGDAAHIGIFPNWEAQYLQSGNKTLRNAIVTNALKALTFDLNYRDVNGYVPNFTQVGTKDVQYGTWPANYAKPSTNKSGAGHSHCPQLGLMAFLCRPSPCFIELAQKACLFNIIWNNNGYGPYSASCEVRAKAWGIRDHAVAILLTPDAHAWKATAQTRLSEAFTHTKPVGNLSAYMTDPRAVLNYLWGGAPNSVGSRPDTVGHGASLFENYYLIQALHMASGGQVLTGTQATPLHALADWCANLPVRYINESVAGEFRAHFYGQDVGTTKDSAINSLPTWGQQIAWRTTDTPPALSGPMLVYNGIQPASWTDAGFVQDNTAGALYPSYFWAALCCAVERSVPGADAAWTKYTTNITNLSTWRNGFAASPRWGYYPRNK